MSAPYAANALLLRYKQVPASIWNGPGLPVATGLLICLAASAVLGGLAASAGVLAFLVLVAVTFFYPDRMLLATLVVAVLVSIEIAIKIEPFPRIGPTRIFVAALFLGTLLNWWIKRELVTRRIHSLPLSGLVLAYSAAVLMSAFMSIAPRKSYYSAAEDVFEQFAFFYLFVYYLRQAGFWPRVQKVLFATTTFVCVVAMVEALIGYNPLAGFFAIDDDLYRGGLLRVRATFFHPIALGCFIDLVFPFVLVALMREKEHRKKLGLAVLLLPMLVTSFLTVSRGPWIALLLEVGVFVTWWTWKSVRRIALVAMLLTTVAVGGTFFMAASDHLGETFGPVMNPNQFSLTRTNEASSEFYRIALLKAVIDRLDGPRWAYGFGRGTFYVAGIESKYDDVEHVLTAGDSHYVLLLLETGIVGLGLFLLLLVGTLHICVQAVRTADRAHKLFALACLAAVIGFIFNNITVSMFSLLPLNLLFWMSIALASVCIGRSTSHKRSSS